MGSFKDIKGQEWQVNITIRAAKRLRDAGFDLAKLLSKDAGWLSQLLGDELGFAAILWAVVRPEAEGRGVSEEAFIELLSGESIEAATAAFEAGLISFFRSPNQRAIVTEILTKTKEIELAATARASRAIRAVTLETVAGPSGGTSTALPGS